MKIYLAGNMIMPRREVQYLRLYKNRLHSYYYVAPDKLENKVFKRLAEELRLMGDGNVQDGDNQELPKP